MYDNLISFCEDKKLFISDTLKYNRYWDWNISVTELLSILEDDSFNYVKRNYAQAIENACERWKQVHSNIEENKFDYKNYYSDSLEISSNNKLDKFYLAYKQWKIINSITILSSEQTFVKDWLRGTIDAITNLWVVDYKTSLKENEKYCIQVAFYCYLSWEENWYILYLSKDKYKFVKVDIQKYMPIVLELIELSKILYKVNKQENGTTKE